MNKISRPYAERVMDEAVKKAMKRKKILKFPFPVRSLFIVHGQTSYQPSFTRLAITVIAHPRQATSAKEMRRLVYSAM